MTANERDDPATPGTPLHGDSEAQAASGVPLPSLRVLQAAGAIRAEKQPKHHGGFRRMWPELEVLKAAAAAAIGEHFAWNIRMVAEAMAKTRPELWESMALIAVEGLEKPKDKKILVKTRQMDWVLELVDRRFLFVRIPEPVRTAAAGIGSTRPELLLGVMREDGAFLSLPLLLGSRWGRRGLRKGLGMEAFRELDEFHKLSFAAYDNFVSMATVNVSMPVRRAWYRLHGHQAHFVQEAIHLKQRRSD